MEPEPIGFSNNGFFLFPVILMGNAINAEVIISALLVVILLVCSALISGSEVAYFSLTHNDIDELEKEESHAANKRVILLLEKPAYLLATILIVNNFINIGIIVLSVIALQPLEWFTMSLEEGTVKTTIDYAINTILVTFFLVLFGEVSPKVYAKLNSLRLAKFMSKILLVLRKILYPLSSILVGSSSFLEKRLESRSNNKFSASEIDQAIDLTVSKEFDSEKEVDILKSIIQFNHIAVKQIMRSRVDVKALDSKTDFKEVLQLVKEWGYSRVPVFDENFDNITGVLHVKDILPHLDKDKWFKWQRLIKQNVMYAPESKKISDLLKEFQEEHTHIAIVIDEYGGSSGIVTLEDVMEEVIGEIKDEFDTQREIDFEKINPYTYIFDGKTMLHDVFKLLDIDMELFEEVRGEADSIGGLMLEQYGLIPQKGRTFKHERYVFSVESASEKRVEKVKLTLPH